MLKRLILLSSLTAVILTAAGSWGATGSVTISTDDTIEAFADFTIEGNCQLSSDDAPKGPSDCGGYLTPYINYYGSHTSATLFTLFDGSYVNRYDISSPSSYPAILGFPVTIANYAMYSTHTVEFRLVDYYGKSCFQDPFNSEAISNGTIATKTVTFTRVPCVVSDSLSADKAVFKPATETITLYGNVDVEPAPATPVWTLGIVDESGRTLKTFSGVGKTVSAIWDGRDPSGNIVPSGHYTAVLRGASQDNTCSKTQTTSFDVCSLAISGFTSAPSSFTPSKCETTTLTGAINGTGGNPVTWQIELAGASGQGPVISASWNGAHKPPGVLTANVTATIASLSCMATSSTDITLDECSMSATIETDKPEIIPDLGEVANITAKPVGAPCLDKTWIATLSGDEVSRQWSGSGSGDAHISWDGKKDNGEYADPGIYHVKVSFKPADSDNCEAVTDDLPVTVTRLSSCPIKTHWGSSVNLATGEVSDELALFSVKGPSFFTPVSLFYNSLDFKSDVLGKGWSHSYELVLISKADGSVFFNDGAATPRFYKFNGAIFDSQAGDHSTLSKNNDGTYSLTESDGSRFDFDSDGNCIVHADKNGNTVMLSYAAGLLKTVSDEAGRTIGFVYDLEGNLISISDPNGNAFGLTYSSDGLMASVSFPTGGKWRYAYDGAGYLKSKIDPNGNATTYSYDDNHRGLAATDPQGLTRKVSYPQQTSGAQRSTSFTEKDGGAWTYIYDSTTGTLTSKTDPLGNVTSHTYDSRRNMLSKTEPGVGTTTYTYDNSNNMTSMTDPLGHTTTYSYNSLGNLLTQTGPSGTITNVYDGTGNLVSATDAVGAKTTYEYDARGNLTRTVNAKGQASVMTYNAAGLIQSSTDPSGATVTYVYDNNGNILTQTDSAGKRTFFDYDAMNRTISTSDPLGNVTAYGYDNVGNRTSQTDANGNTTTYQFNFQGDMVVSKDALGNVTSYSYGATGCPSCGGGVDKLTSVSDAKEQTTSYTYDQLGRIVGEIDPLGRGVVYGYDVAGNLITKTDVNGTSTGYTYDSMKRLTSKIYPDGSTRTYSYDAAGHLASASNDDVYYSYGYDAGGRVTNVTDSRGFTVSYEYDLLGNRTKTTLQKGTPDERVTSYIYDNGNRLQTINSPVGTFGFGYDLQGRRVSVSYPNGVVTGYAYDDAGRLTSVGHSGASGATIAQYSHTLDRVGNRLTKSGTVNEIYSYDLINRLLQSVTPAGTEKYSYDAVGNRLSGPGAKDTGYLYNAANQMTKGRQFTYDYDNNGNQTSRTIGNVTGKSWTQTWDYENRLVKLEKVRGADKQTVTFKYDSMGRRIQKQLVVAKDGNVSTSTWAYFYDNDNIALEVYVDQTGNTEKTYYTHGPAVDSHLALERGGRYLYYHADSLGSVVAITDGNGKIAQSYVYEAFGAGKPSTSFRNSYTYTGREWDKETGLYYFRARYYDPMEGRFISKDPIGFDGGDVNLYGYVRNNPIRYTDKFGLMTDAEKADNEYCKKKLLKELLKCQKECNPIKRLICEWKANWNANRCVAEQNDL